jgi:dipeptidase E
VHILLISNSGRPILEHARPVIAKFLGGCRRIGFVSAAAYEDEAGYCDRVRRALAPDGIVVDHIGLEAAPLEAIAAVDAVFVGGGNTYHLLSRLHAAGVVQPIAARVHAGMPYIGSSAGSNVAGPNILTTNDWNVDGVARFDALGLVPFNINPHYRETDPVMAPGSETRDERIGQYLHVRDNPVVGIEEETCVVRHDDTYTVEGRHRVKVFVRGRDPRWFASGERLAW